MKNDILPHLKIIDGRAEAMVARITRWANINSGTANLAGIESVAADVIGEFKSLKFAHLRQASQPVSLLDDLGQHKQLERGPIEKLTLRPDAKRRILLVGHLDTVFPESHAFQTVQRRNDGSLGDILNGPGVADMKGGICVMLEAARAFEASPFAEHVGIDVLLNADEETGSHASADALAAAAHGADIGLVFEPALPDGTLAGARAGSGEYVFVVRGVAAHAGRDFHLGRNAIVAASKVVLAIDALNGNREGVTLNPGMVTGGQATNVVPDLAIVRVNVRARSAEDQLWVDQALHRIVEDQDFGEDVSVVCHGGITRPVKNCVGGTAQLFEAVAESGKQIGLSIAWKSTGGCCDGNNLAANGLPVVDTLGVRGGAIHSDQEFAVIESFEERVRLTALLMMRLAAGELAWPDRLPT